MRTPRFLSIAGVLGLTLVAALFWHVEQGSDAASDVASNPAVGLADAARIEGGAASSRDPVRIDTTVESVVHGADSLASGGRALRGSVALVDRADPAFEQARSSLAEAIERRLPALALSNNELDALADASLRLRAAQAALRAIPETKEHADQRAHERERLEEAIGDFVYVVEMTPAEFAQRVEPGVGIDEWPPDQATPGDVMIRPIRTREAPE